MRQYVPLLFSAIALLLAAIALTVALTRTSQSAPTSGCGSSNPFCVP